MADRKTAVVAGGTGGIGEGIVKALIEGGWTVYVPTRGQDRGERLKAYLTSGHERLKLLPADLASAQDVAAFRSALLAEAGALDLVVVSVGSSYYGYSLHKIPEGDWDRILRENLSTHFHLQHELLAQLHQQNRGTYVTLTGPEADFAHPETGMMSILAAAQKMMARVEAMEAAGTGVRVYSVTSKTPIATRARGEQSGPDWIHPEEMGLYVRALADIKVPGTTEPLHVLETREQLRRLLKL
jgi:NAD(P)-dependent dehydrogenase (short-subunit alcohol dehydrogenase family)